MNVVLKSVQSSLNNYSGLHLILKPIVYLVAGIALALFATMAINALAFTKPRREQRATTPTAPSTPPSMLTDHLSGMQNYPQPTVTSPQPTTNSISPATVSTPSLARPGPVSTPPPAEERKPFNIQYRADAYENDRDGVYEITIADRLQEAYPDVQLKALSTCILLHGVLPNLQLRYLDDNLDAHISFDTGGMGRQYMTLLCKALKKQNAKNPSGDFILHHNLLVPQREFSFEDLLPHEGMLSEPSREAIKLLLGAPLFYHIGAVMAYVYLNPNAYLTGTIFHPAIFSAIFSLSEVDIDTPFNELSNQRKIAMCRTLINAQMETGEDFAYLLSVLDLLEKWDEATDEEIRNVESFYYIACLGHDKGNDDKFIKADHSGFDLEAITKDKEGFLKSCFDFLLQQPTPSLGTIGLVLYPIHTMAKGMIAGATEDRWREIWSSTESLMMEIDPENGIPDLAAATRRAVERLHRGIQGSLDRQLLISKIAYAEGCHDIIRQKGKFLEDWILRPETTDSQIETLLIIWTGSSTVDSDLSKKLTIEPQKIVYVSGTDEIKYGYAPFPRAQSCTKVLEFAPVWFEESLGPDGIPAPHDKTPIGFYHMMDNVTTGKGEYKWTMH